MNNPGPLYSHKARLAFIEEIKKEPCKHWPTLILNCNEPAKYEHKCKHCGVELIANWSEKK